jgi:hypothetical protein
VFTVGVIFLLIHLTRLPSAGRGSASPAAWEAMLAEPSDRIQGQFPALPRPWHAESVIRSAGGTRFAGDFFVVGDIETGRLGVTAVDVSGKAHRAGTRASCSPAPWAAWSRPWSQSSFARRQRLPDQPPGQDGPHAPSLSLDLTTATSGSGRPGTCRRSTGGRPGAGRSRVRRAQLGPILGATSTTPAAPRPGDALMLYTDGMVETRRADIGIGIDRLIGQADRKLRATSRAARPRWWPPSATGATTVPCCCSGATDLPTSRA